MSCQDEPVTVQLGFSEPISDPSDAEGMAHNSPNWTEWDGGKIGGAPSWLNPKDLPITAPLRCAVCARRNAEAGEIDKEGTLLRFMTQIYSPADSATGNENAFHRSLYVFCCPHPICSSAENAHESVVVLRGQLPKVNEFYPAKCDGEDEESWDKHKSASWDVKLCILCGQRASGRCPIANQSFCCKYHQRDYHQAMKKNTDEDQEVDLSPYVYAESELVVEEEPSETQNGDGHDAEGKLADEINKASMFAHACDESDELLEQSDLNEMSGTDTGTSDNTTLEFYTRIGRADGDLKSQCLRYCRWPDTQASDDDLESSNGPLWISSTHRPTVDEDIPHCEYCGAKRKFEFQVMPQMVSFIKGNTDDNKDAQKGVMSEEKKRALLDASDIVDQAKEEGTESNLPQGFQKRQEELKEKFKAALLQDGKKDEALDFGTIAVFSCTASCGGNETDGPLGAYRQEFAWRQKPLE